MRHTASERYRQILAAHEGVGSSQISECIEVVASIECAAFFNENRTGGTLWASRNRNSGFAPVGGPDAFLASSPEGTAAFTQDGPVLGNQFEEEWSRRNG